MKTIVLTLIIVSCLFVGNIYAQNPNQPHAITYKMGGADFHTPLASESPLDANNLNLFGELGFGKSINRFLNIQIPLKVGVFDLPNESGTYTNNRMLASIDAIAELQYWKQNNLLVPYLMAGVGVAGGQFEGIGANIPLGAGLKFQVMRNLFIVAQTEYRIGLSENKTNWQHSAGLQFPLGGEGIVEEEPKIDVVPTDTDADGVPDATDRCPNVPGKALFAGCPDTDDDGVEDENDQCPEIAGTIAMNGCPDGDGDGVADINDDCPDEAGPLSNKGCPVPTVDLTDSDNDGVIDSEDECPGKSGLKRFNGCPDTDADGTPDKTDECPNTAGTVALKGCPDTDNDGVIDSRDKCPTVAGPASTAGCPEIKQEEKEVLNFAMKAVQFETGSNTLKVSSYQVLDQIVDILKRYPGHKLSISGHTDSVGSSAKNQELSERRANACRDYIVRKGIESARVSARGLGETQPIADNTFKEGREQNRRVEFNIYL